MCVWAYVSVTGCVRGCERRCTWAPPRSASTVRGEHQVLQGGSLWWCGHGQLLCAGRSCQTRPLSLPVSSVLTDVWHTRQHDQQLHANELGYHHLVFQNKKGKTGCVTSTWLSKLLHCPSRSYHTVKHHRGAGAVKTVANLYKHRE